MDGAFVRANPAQLAVGGDVAPKAAHVLGHPIHVQADYQVAHGFDSSAANLIAPANGEGEPMALHAALLGLQDDVGGGIVWVRVHGVRAIEVLRGGETYIHHPHAANFVHDKPVGFSVFKK